MATLLPCSVRHVTDTLTIEQSSNLLPVKGCNLVRTDGIRGVITAIYASKAEVKWRTGKIGVYTIKYGAIA